MAFAGSRTIVKGGTALHVYVDGFDADNEEVVVDCIECDIAGFRHASIIVQRTAGATALISVKVQGSNDNTTWADITGAAVTAKDTHAAGVDDDYSGAVDAIRYRYAKILCATVGAGNTLDAYVTLSERH